MRDSDDDDLAGSEVGADDLSPDSDAEAAVDGQPTLTELMETARQLGQRHIAPETVANEPNATDSNDSERPPLIDTTPESPAIRTTDDDAHATLKHFDAARQRGRNDDPAELEAVFRVRAEMIEALHRAHPSVIRLSRSIWNSEVWQHLVDAYWVEAWDPSERAPAIFFDLDRGTDVVFVFPQTRLVVLGGCVRSSSSVYLN